MKRFKAQRELTSLKEKVKEVENYEKDKKNFEDKIATIEQLKRTRRACYYAG